MCIPKKAAKEKRVVIIGGGYAGQAAGRLLDGDFAVTVVEPREFLVHKIAGVRACVRPEWAEALLVPQATALTRGKRVQTAVSKASGSSVVLADGRSLAFDYLVVASGGISVSPAEPQGSANLKQHYEQVAAAIDKAQHVLVVGGGPVGVELTGEIRGKFPEKKITLVHAGAKLVDNVKATPEEKFHEELKAKLEAKHVELRLGVKAELSETEGKEAKVTEPRTVKLSDGSADDVKETKTYVVCGTQIGKMEGWPRGHADVVNDNIRALEKKTALAKYTPNTQWFGMILPIGPSDSVVAGYPEGFGAYKAASYFIANQYEAVGLPAPTLPSL
jgi:NADH dehydrogenase FAD-containing subunit